MSVRDLRTCNRENRLVTYFEVLISGTVCVCVVCFVFEFLFSRELHALPRHAVQLLLVDNAGLKATLDIAQLPHPVDE